MGGCARVGRCGGMLGGGGMRRPKSGQNRISTSVAAKWYQVRGEESREERGEERGGNQNDTFTQTSEGVLLNTTERGSNL